MKERPAVLVTGASGRIGRAICVEFGRSGWRVGVHYHHGRVEAQRTSAELTEAGGEGVVFQADVQMFGQVCAMVKSFIKRWKRLDVLVCNAGHAPGQLVVRTGLDEWRQTVGTNLTGTFHCLKAAGPHLLAQGKGSVVVVGSFAGSQGKAGQAAYAASKGGLLGLMRTAAREWGPRDVRVNAILPGWHRTDLSGDSLPGSDGLTDHVLGRTPDLSEVARSVFHLALQSDVSGQVWNLDSRPLY